MDGSRPNPSQILRGVLGMQAFGGWAAFFCAKDFDDGCQIVWGPFWDIVAR